MIDNFAACLDFTLRYEGGFADDPRDPGGRTMRGITQATYDAWRRRQGQPRADVRGIVPAELRAIYREGYWAGVDGDRLPAGLDLAAFDFAVNSGPARARAAVRDAAGPDAAAAVKRLCARRLSFLHALGTFRTFGRGWTARVMACEALGVRMAEQERIGRPAAAEPEPQVIGRLKAEAQIAARRARTHRSAAGASLAGATAAPGATAAGTLPPTLAVLMLVVLGALALALALAAYRAGERARAYATLAG